VKLFPGRTLVPMSLCLATACGYSQEEWDQKVRENESLRNQLTAQKQAHEKCETDYASALHEVDDLKQKLRERGVNLDNLTQSLEQERRALEEFKRRAEQLDQDAHSTSRRRAVRFRKRQTEAAR